MKKSTLAAMALMFASTAFAANDGSVVIPLWEAKAAPVEIPYPGDEKIEDGGIITDVSVPTLEIFKARGENPSGKSVIICPGGGYFKGAYHHEGIDIARWLAENGITAAVLKYRLPAGNETVPSDDAARAFEIMREKAGELGIAPDSIGIMGASAGGHLACTMLTLRAPEVKPAFGVLFYPVVSMKTGLTHDYSRKCLLGENFTPEQVAKYSLEDQVNDATPSILFLASDNDNTVLIENTYNLVNAMKEHKKPVSMHIFPTGSHGWGFHPTFKYHNIVKSAILDWIQTR